MTRVKRLFGMPVLYFLFLYLFVFLLKSPELAKIACLDSIGLCLISVIPSLFPFLVLNELMLSSGLSSMLGRKLGRPLAKLFSISPEGAVSLLYGSLFGFPLGTKSVCSFFENGALTKEEAQRLVCFCSNTGPAFVIGFAGGILQNKNVALCIYFCQIFSAIIIALFLRNKNIPTYPQNYTPVKFDVSCIPKAITSSVFPMLNICAFVCFFSCVSLSIENILFRLNLNEYTEILFTGLLELTNGISRLSSFTTDNISVWLCAFFIGWSGVSVIMQSISIMKEQGLQCKKFIVCKLIQGILCANMSVLFCNLLNLY